MTFLVDPPVNDEEAKAVIEAAYSDVFSDWANETFVFPDGEPNLFAVGIAQAIAFVEGGPYGKWGPNGKSNHWGAITRVPNSDGTCAAGAFTHKDSKFSEEEGKVVEYTTCFALYPTSLDGAKDFLRELYVKRPNTFQAALSGDIRGVAEDMYATNYYLGTAPPDAKDADGNFVNVNNYIALIGRGVNQIAHLYPSGGDDGGLAPGQKPESNTGMVIGITAAAVLGLAIAMNR